MCHILLQPSSFDEKVKYAETVVCTFSILFLKVYNLKKKVYDLNYLN